MARPLYDADGELTALGAALRICALVVAIASVLGIAPACIYAMLAPMFCDSPCTTAVAVAGSVMALSPLLLLISAMSGVVAFRSPSWSLILLTLIPAAIAGTAFLVLGDLSG